MRKKEMKKNTDKHIAAVQGIKVDKRKGHRSAAWEECIALEKLIQFNKGVI